MTAVFLAALLVSTGVRLWLSRRHERHVLAHRDAVPAAFEARIPLDAHRKAADYTVARVRAGRFETVAAALLLLGWTLGGGIDLLARPWDGGSIPGGAGLLLSAFLASGLLMLPFRIHRTFGIEERFGFNRTTPRLFCADLAREALLGLLLGGAVALAALWIVTRGGAYWWLWLWGGWLGFSLLIVWVYPTWIAPLFHKFTPLPDDALAARLRELLARTGFASDGIFVMDGSRRSAHSNAYFTGFGSRKRIVLYDTLVDLLDPPEVEAVLAHELAHFKLRHVWSGLAVGAALGLLGLAALRGLIDKPWFFEGLGVHAPSAATGLLLFVWVAPVFAFLLAPLLNAWSRRHEYEADAFAAAHADGAALAAALVKMYRENAATLTPDELYSKWHASHPPAALRIARLEVR